MDILLRRKQVSIIPRLINRHKTKTAKILKEEFNFYQTDQFLHFVQIVQPQHDQSIHVKVVVVETSIELLYSKSVLKNAIF